ncbi:MAG: LysM peptidoglycan-binding domain-containing protein [Bacillaceae bacterium]|nr:LysM peptidoglycan-binding domain-containing protein [Bacillaceae bacterium]
MTWNQLQTTWIYPQDQLIVSPVRTYQVKAGDFLWKIAKEQGTTVETIQNLNHLTSSLIYPGQTLRIPESSAKSSVSDSPQPEQSRVEYKTHTVQQGETGWTIALKYGIPFQEFLDLNNLKESSILMPGDQVTVAIHHIAVKPTLGPRFGEYLDWWSEAQYVWPIGTVAKVTDFETGASWKMKRTIGAFHADVEPLTAQDTATMKKVWGGTWSWERRPVLVEVNGHRIAASASAMPHSVQYIQDNQFPGHTDIHFAGSRRHKDNRIDPEHQKNVRIAAGQDQ